MISEKKQMIQVSVEKPIVKTMDEFIEGINQTAPEEKLTRSKFISSLIMDFINDVVSDIRRREKAKTRKEIN